MFFSILVKRSPCHARVFVFYAHKMKKNQQFIWSLKNKVLNLYMINN